MSSKRRADCGSGAVTRTRLAPCRDLPHCPFALEGTLSDERPRLATDARRVALQEVARATHRVVRVCDLSCGLSGSERSAVHLGTGTMAEHSGIQVRAVVESALLPAQRASLAPGAASTAQSRTTAARRARTGRAGSRRATATRLVTKTSGADDQQTGQRSNPQPTVHRRILLGSVGGRELPVRPTLVPPDSPMTRHQKRERLVQSFFRSIT